MHARKLFGAALFVLAIVPATPANAGGGGCYEQTQGSGDAIVIEHACFTPSILHVEPGALVSFENRDDFDHNVYGTGWGIGELGSGRDARTTFHEEGLYPFQCSLHPGMTGVVVVGDGEGPGNGAAVAMQASGLTPPAEPAAGPASDVRQGSSPAGVLGLLIGLALGAAAVAIAPRRRRAPAMETSA